MEKRIVRSKDEARQYAIDWQMWASEAPLYLTELVDWYDEFTKIGKRWGLLREFREEGIL